MGTIARVIGLRERADGSELKLTAKVLEYVLAVVFVYHPVHTLRVNVVRELQTLATALDLLECGSLADWMC